jgi:hypothetical protein
VTGAENRALRRPTHGPPSPGAIRTTVRNRVGSQLIRTTVAIAAATTIATPAGPIYPLTRVAPVTGRSRSGSPAAPPPEREGRAPPPSATTGWLVASNCDRCGLRQTKRRGDCAPQRGAAWSGANPWGVLSNSWWVGGNAEMTGLGGFAERPCGPALRSRGFATDRTEQP